MSRYRLLLAVRVAPFALKRDRGNRVAVVVYVPARPHDRVPGGILGGDVHFCLEELPTLAVPSISTSKPATNSEPMTPFEDVQILNALFTTVPSASKVAVQ